MQYHRWAGFTPGDTISYRFCMGGEVSSRNVIPTYISNGPIFVTYGYCIVELNAINSPPVVLSVPLTEARAGVAYSYTIVAEDIDGDPLTYTPLVLPGWLSFVPPSCFPSGATKMPSVPRKGSITMEICHE